MGGELLDARLLGSLLAHPQDGLGCQPTQLDFATFANWTHEGTGLVASTLKPRPQRIEAAVLHWNLPNLVALAVDTDLSVPKTHSCEIWASRRERTRELEIARGLGS
jgi:hypothetical protein